MSVQYQDARPIETCPVSVWLVQFPTGEQRITIWSKDTTIEDVHHFYHVRGHKKFLVGMLGVGEWTVLGVKMSYADDGRLVNQDWEVCMEGYDAAAVRLRQTIHEALEAGLRLCDDTTVLESPFLREFVEECKEKMIKALALLSPIEKELRGF